MTLKESLRKNLLFLLTLFSIIIGVLLGFALRSKSYEPNSLAQRLIHFPGELFLRGIKLMIIPLLTSSLITGIAGDSVTHTGSIARRTLVFFLVTSVAAVLLAVVLVVTMQPGRDIVADQLKTSFNSTSSEVKPSGWDTLMDVLRNIVPDNFVEMAFQVHRSKFEVDKSKTVLACYSIP